MQFFKTFSKSVIFEKKKNPFRQKIAGVFGGAK